MTMNPAARIGFSLIVDGVELWCLVYEAHGGGACMIRLSQWGSGVDTHAFLIAFCALAMELYPELDWIAVEPKLQRSWERYQGDDRCRWAAVRDVARARWEAQPKPNY